MIYESIPGWFQYPDVYSEMVSRHEGGIFVEVGTFQGRSAAFMAETIKNSGKRIKFYTLDNHEFYRNMTPEEWEANNVSGGFGYTVDDVRKNLEPLKDWVEIVVGNSWEGIPGVEKVDFCWIDASHEYESVKKDILYWLPRSKILGGDDIGFGGVSRAVQELCPGYKLTSSGGWILDPNPFYD